MSRMKTLLESMDSTRSPIVMNAINRSGSGVHTDKRKAKEAKRLRDEAREAKYSTECMSEDD